MSVISNVVSVVMKLNVRMISRNMLLLMLMNMRSNVIFVLTNVNPGVVSHHIRSSLS